MRTELDTDTIGDLAYLLEKVGKRIGDDDKELIRLRSIVHDVYIARLLAETREPANVLHLVR